jgi:hypothetical protein
MTLSVSRRYSKEQAGGNGKPRTERPVRQRVVNTYFPSGSILVLESFSISKQVECLASGAYPPFL